MLADDVPWEVPAELLASRGGKTRRMAKRPCEWPSTAGAASRDSKDDAAAAGGAAPPPALVTTPTPTADGDVGDGAGATSGAGTGAGASAGAGARGDADAQPMAADGGAAASRPPLRLLGGVDISFIKGSPVDACVALVVVELPSLEVVYERLRMVELTLPYISGFLAFRECVFIEEEVAHLRATQPELVPQVILVDGNGVLHPRGLGLASHLGVVTGVPTIGVAKTFLHVDGLTKDVAKHAAEANAAPGDAVELLGDSGRVWGAAFKSTKGSNNPVYISQGHRVSLATALAVTRCCCQYRIPEPVRKADLRSREFLREYEAAAAAGAAEASAAAAGVAAAVTSGSGVGGGDTAGGDSVGADGTVSAPDAAGTGSGAATAAAATAAAVRTEPETAAAPAESALPDDFGW